MKGWEESKEWEHYKRAERGRLSFRLEKSSHPIQRSNIYTTSHYGQKMILCVKVTVMRFFYRINDLGKGFADGVKERLHLKIRIPLQIKTITLKEIFLSAY